MLTRLQKAASTTDWPKTHQQGSQAGTGNERQNEAVTRGRNTVRMCSWACPNFNRRGSCALSRLTRRCRGKSFFALCASWRPWVLLPSDVVGTRIAPCITKSYSASVDRCERPILRNVGRQPSRRHSSAIKAWKNSKLGTRDAHLQRYISQLEQTRKLMYALRNTVRLYLLSDLR